MRTDQPSPPPWDRKERKVERGGGSISGSGSVSGVASDALGGSSIAPAAGFGPRWRDQQHHRGRPGFGQPDSERFEPRHPPPGHHRFYPENSPSRSDRFNSVDERRQTRDNSTNHNSFRRSPYLNNSPSDFHKRPLYDAPIVTAPRSLAIPISTAKPPPTHQPDHHEDSTLGSISWKPLKWARSVSETPVKEAPIVSPILSPQLGDEVAVASRKKARLGWGQGLAKYEKEKVQGSVESSGGGPSESGLNNGPVTSPATPLSATSRPPPQVHDEKLCGATVSAENNASHQNAPEPKELSLKLDNINSGSVDSLSALLSNLLQQEDSCTGDSTFLTKVSLLKVDISKELEKTECEIDSLELELRSLESDSKTDNNKTNELNVNENNTLKVEEAQESEEMIRVGDNTSTEFIEPSSSKSCADNSYADLIVSIIASNEESAKLSRQAIEKYKVVWSPEVDLWDSVKGSSLRRNDVKIREKLRVRRREVRFKEKVLALKFMALRRLWKEDLRLLDVKKNFTKSGKRAALSSVPLQYHSQKQRNCILRSLLALPDGVSTLVPSSEILYFSRNLLANSEVKHYREVEKMPSLILDRKEKENSRFLSKNGLIEDPVSFERDRSMINPWTKEEKEVFMEILGTIGKEFTIISSYLTHKSTADCVEFYYKNRRSESFSEVRRRLLMKKKEEMKSKARESGYFMRSGFGRKWSRESRISESALDILGAASLVAAYNQGGISTGTSTGTGTSSRGKQNGSSGVMKSHTSHGSLENKESLAANVLAGIGKAVSSEAVSSCITSSTGPVSKTGHVKATVKGLDEDSEESCGDELVSADWMDAEKSIFLQAYSTYGKDFTKISNCVGTRSRDECKVFFSKAQRSLGLVGLSDERATNGLAAPSSPAGNGDDVCVAEIDSGVCSLQSCSKDVSKVGEGVVAQTSNDGSGENEISVDKQETGTDGIITDLNDRPINEEEKNRSFGLAMEKIDLEVNVDEERGVKKEAVPVVILDKIGSGTNTGTSTGLGKTTKDGGERPTDAGTGMLRERASSPHLVSMPHQTGTARSRRRASIDLGTSSVISFALDPSTLNGNVPSRPTFGTGYNSQLPLEILPFMLKENQANSRSVPVQFSQAFSNPSTAFSFSGNNNLCNLSQTTLNFEEHLNKNAVPLQPYMQKNPLTNQTNQMMDVLKGYPLQVPNHKRNEFAQPNQSAFVLNNGPGILFAPTKDDKCEIQTRPVIEQVDPAETVQRSNHTGDVKLFGKILTQSARSEKPISNENITRKPSPNSSSTSLNILNGPLNHILRDGGGNNAFFPTPDNLGLDGLPVRSYGFWDGNRIQTGFSSLPESARIVVKYQESLAGVLPSNNVNLSSFKQPHMQQLVSNGRSGFTMVVPKRSGIEMVQQSGVGTNTVGTGTGTGMGLFRPGMVSVSDPVAALKMHFGSNGAKVCSNNSGNEIWRGGDVGR